MTTSDITGTVTTGITLTIDNIYTNPVTIDAGAYVSNNTGPAVEAATSWSVANLGTIAGIGAVGVYFYDGGGITNGSQGAISGEVGVVATGTTGTVGNAGTITGSDFGVRLIVGGTVVNQAGGVITGAGDADIYIGHAAGTVANYGAIGGPGLATYGVKLTGGGVVTNGSQGTIDGTAGVFIASAAGTIGNAGTITGTVYGIQLNVGGTVSNTGTIQSDALGIKFLKGGSITNAAGGLIQGSTDGVFGSGTATTVTNAGTIEGGTGIAFNNTLGNDTVINSGTIIGTNGVAVQFGIGNDLLEIYAGASFVGAVNGGGGSNTLEYGGTIAGTITNLDGPSFTGFNTVEIASGSNWTVTGTNTIASGVYLLDSGSLTVTGALTNNGNLAVKGALINSGTIAGTTYGVKLSNGGRLTNDSQGTIDGSIGVYVGFDGGEISNAGTIIGGSDGVRMLTGTLFNTGTIEASSDYVFFVVGVENLAGGSITNAAGALIQGSRYGVQGDDIGVATTVTNAGTIKGVEGVYFGNSMDSHPTIVNDTLINSGTIIGSDGVAVQFGTGDDLLELTGAAVFVGAVDGGTGNNTLELGGTIAGTITGLGTTFYGFETVEIDAGSNWTLAGYNMIGVGGTLIDNGNLTVMGNLVDRGSLSLSGTLTDGGMIFGYGTAVQFGAGDDLLKLLPGASFTGTVDGGAGNNTLELGGTIAGYLSGLGTSITNFQTFEIDAGSNWTLTGDNTIAQGVTFIDNGELTVAGTLVDDTGHVFAGTLIDSGTIVGTAGVAVQFGAGNDTLKLEAGAAFVGAVDGGAGNNTLELGGTIAGHLTGLGSNITNFETVAVDAGVNWTVTGANTIASGVTLTDSGNLTNSGTLTNSGALIVHGQFYDLGTVSNQSGAQIIGDGTAIQGGAGAATVINAGTISGLAGGGVQLRAGGELVNQAGGVVIAGAGYNTDVYFGHAGAVINYGTIGGASLAMYGVVLTDGGVVTNGSTAAIYASALGVFIASGQGTVVNAGTITAAIDGVDLGGGSITNAAGGLIQGNTDGVSDSGSTTVTNAGTIEGGTGVVFNNGGNNTVINSGTIVGTSGVAVKFGNGNDLLEIYVGASFVGTVSGGAGYNTLEYGGTIAGTITNLDGPSYTGFNTVEIASGSNWTLTGDNTIATGITLTDSGTLTNSGSLTVHGQLIDAGTLSNQSGAQIVSDGTAVFGGVVATVINAGTITGLAGYGVELNAGGRIVNQTGALIAGSGANASILAVSGAATVVNYGTIGGIDGNTEGVVLGKGGSVTNASQGTIEGYIGIYIGRAAAGTIINAGTIADAKYGVRMLGGGTLSNTGSIQGSAIGVQAMGAGPLSVTNTGTIEGGTGVRFSDNYGTFANTVIDSGAIIGTSGVAVQFGSGNDLLELQAGAAFTGTVDGGAGDNTLELGGTIAGSFTGLGGVSFANFQTVEVDAGSDWTLTGDNTVATGVTLTDSGTLRNAGTLANNGALYVTGTLINQYGAQIVGNGNGIDGGAGATVVNSGTISTTGGLAAGIYLKDGGSITNDSGATVAGGYGIFIRGSDAATVVNAGTITGYRGSALLFGAGNDLLELTAGAAFVGTVDGGTGSNTLELGGTIAGTISGLGGPSFTGFNTVEIDAGSNWTLSGDNTIASGVTLIDNGELTVTGTLIDNGSLAITGTLIDSGTIVGTNGATVQFGAGDDTLKLQAGAFTGAVDGGAGNNTLELGGTIAGYLSGLGTSITNFQTIEVDAGSDWTLTGANTIASGVTLTDSGSLTNSGSLTVYGQLVDAGTLSNQSGAQIVGNGIAIYGDVGATVINAGTITVLAGNGVDLAGGGKVVNQADALILATGEYNNAGVLGGAGYTGTVANYGTISGVGGAYGVSLLSGGGVTNGSQGTISGYTGIAFHYDGTVGNAGAIIGTRYGVDLVAGGTVSNAVGALIQGVYEYGVVGFGAPSTVTNDGAIIGNEGVYFSDNTGTYANTVIDSGTIDGLNGTAVQFGAGDDLLKLEAGAVLVGTVDGAGGNNTLELGGTIAGTISGLGTQFTSFQTIYVDAGSDWTLTGANTIVSGVYLTDNGTLQNAGSLANGWELDVDGTLINQAGAQIIASAVGEGDAIDGKGTAGATIVNDGTIVALGMGASGIYLSQGGSITNGASATIAGDYGIYIHGPNAATVVNAGTITGYGGLALQFGDADDLLVIQAGAVFNGEVNGGDGTNTLELGGTIAGSFTGLGTYFVNFQKVEVDAGSNWTLNGPNTISYGVTLTDSGTLTNAGTLNAIGVVTDYGTLNNSGSISGTVTLASSGVIDNEAGGVISGGTAGVVTATGADGTLINAGTIIGGGGVAVQFGTGGSTLEILAGAVFDGTADGDGGTIELGGTIAGSITGIGTTFTDFETLKVDAGSNWTLTGTNYMSVTYVTGQGSLTNEGTLIGGGTAFSVYGSDVNTGVIVDSTGVGVFLRAGGSIDNLGSGAQINGYGAGIYAGSYAFATVANTGTIVGTAGSHASTAFGIHAKGGGTLTNAAGGLISGATRGVEFDGDATITNGGTIAGGDIGIEFNGTDADTVINSGTIVGSGGEAILFGSGNDLLELRAGAVFGGTVNGGGGTNTLEFGGASPASFTGLGGSSFANFSHVEVDAGSDWAFTGANTVASGVTLTDSGTITGAIHIGAGGGEIVVSGGHASGVVVQTSGLLTVRSGGVVSGITVSKGGTVVFAGGTSSKTNVNGGTATVGAGGHTISDTIVSGGTETVNAGATASSAHVGKSGTIVFAGGTSSKGVISAGGKAVVGKGGHTVSDTISSGGTETVDSGGIASGAHVLKGGTIVFAGGTSSKSVISASGKAIVSKGGHTIGDTISSGGIETVSAGATASGTHVLKGGTIVYGGGTVTGAAISSGGAEVIAKGAKVTGLKLAKGVTLTVSSGGTASKTVISGGTEVVVKGGVIGGAVTFGTSGTLSVATTPTAKTLTISGFKAKDTLDLSKLKFTAGEKLSFVENAKKTSGTLTITSGSLHASVTLFGQYVAGGFHLASDKAAGTAVTYSGTTAHHLVLAGHGG